MEFTAQQIAQFVQGRVEGDENATVNTFAKIEEGKDCLLYTSIQHQWPTYQEPQRKPAAADRCLRKERHGICRGTSRYR